MRISTPATRRLAALATATVATGLVLAGCSNTVDAPDKEAAADFQPVTVTDCKGANPHTFDAPVDSVISSNNNGADLLARVGAANTVVGLGWANGLDALDPEIRAQLTGARRLSEGNIDRETLLSQNAQVFLATFEDMQMMGTAEPSAEQFAEAGMTKVLIKSSACAKYLPGARTDLEQVYEDIRNIAALTNHRDKGTAIVDRMRSDLTSIRAGIREGAAKPRVAYYDAPASRDKVTTLGNRQIGNAVFALAGVESIGAGVDKPFTKMDHEAFVTADPDWIVVSVRRTGDAAAIAAAHQAAENALRNDPRTAGMRAVREGKFIRLTSEAVTLAGPANVDAVRTIADAVRR